MPARPERDDVRAPRERAQGVGARPDLAGGEDGDLGRQRGAQERQRVLVGVLHRGLRDVPERRVDEVGAVLGEPAGDLEVVVEVHAARVAEILEREPHADREAGRSSTAGL